MPRHASAIAAAELRVLRSRSDLRDSLQCLRRSLSRPPVLATATAAGALLVFLLIRRGRSGALAGALAVALFRYGITHLLLARASTPTTAPPTPSP